MSTDTPVASLDSSTQSGSHSVNFDLSTNNGVLEYLFHLAKLDLANLQSASRLEEQAIDLFVQKVRAIPQLRDDHASTSNHGVSSSGSPESNQLAVHDQESRSAVTSASGAGGHLLSEAAVEQPPLPDAQSDQTNLGSWSKASPNFIRRPQYSLFLVYHVSELELRRYPALLGNQFRFDRMVLLSQVDHWKHVVEAEWVSFNVLCFWFLGPPRNYMYPQWAAKIDKGTLLPSYPIKSHPDAKLYFSIYSAFPPLHPYIP